MKPESDIATPWMTATHPLLTEGLVKNNWGIAEPLVPELLKILKEEGTYRGETDVTALPFSALKSLIKLLYHNNLDTADLPSAIDIMLRTPNRTLIRNLQQVLKKFISQQQFAPDTIKSDGEWSSALEQVLSYVLNSFNLAEQTLSAELVQRLDTIAGRLVHLYSNSQQILPAAVILQNPFCIIDSDADQYELKQEGADGVVIATSKHQPVARFAQLFSAGFKDEALFNKFSAWLLLLNMTGTGKYENHCELFIHQDEDQWTPLEKCYNPGEQEKFAIEPDFFLAFPGTALLPLLMKNKQEEELDIVAVYLSRDVKISISSGYRLNNTTNGVEVSLDFEHFFETVPGSVDIIEGPADYCKLFVVKKGFVNHALETGYRSLAGTELPQEFYRLLSADSHDIVAAVTIGLQFKHALSTNDFDKIVKRVYANQDITVPEDLQKNRWGGIAENNGKRLKAAVEKTADDELFHIVLIVENLEATNKKEEQVAFFLHNSFNQEVQYETIVKGKAQIELTAYEAFTAGAYTEDGTMLELDMNEGTSYPRKLFYEDVSDDFRTYVETMYAKQPTQIAEDIQKNRWGGRSINRGKKIYAEAQPGFIEGTFNVTLIIDSETPAQILDGDVAFFIHDSFAKQVCYTRAHKGQAKITVNAREAFTVGAYTADGSLLELDLNHSKGLPENFYQHSAGNPAM
ncbi:MAG: hypothetical protein JWQ27_1754 [Ferruginibacter sp.]|nr:hypothetical protein [Ferruginibacter sp.]